MKQEITGFNFACFRSKSSGLTPVAITTHPATKNLILGIEMHSSNIVIKNLIIHWTVQGGVIIVSKQGRTDIIKVFFKSHSHSHRTRGRKKTSSTFTIIDDDAFV